MEGREALTLFLRTIGPCEPEKEASRRGVETAINDLLNNDPPEFNTVKRIIERARDIGLDLDLWAAQNIIWDRHLGDSRAAELINVLNFGG
jgi:hypothetical protein